MQIDELLDAAKRKKGSLKEIAEGIDISQARLSDWRAGRRKPDANEIAYLADCAGLPIFETVAEIESQLDSRFSAIWQSALGKLRAAQNENASGLATSLMISTSQIDDWRKR